MKIKANFEFEGELPKELWWIDDVDWGDEEVRITLEQGNLVLRRGHSIIPLKTKCTGMNVIGILRDLDS